MMLGMSDPLSRWAALLAAAVLSGLLAAIIQRAVHRDHAVHGAAFRRLARGVGLGPLERRTLRRLACAGGFPSAACLLISRGCFDAAAERASAGLVPRTQLERLRGRIFD